MAELFIVGLGRSGTSLLQSMFAAHPAVAMLPETSFLRRYVSGPGLGPEPVGAPGGGPGAGDHGSTAPWVALYERDERLQRLDRESWARGVAAAYGAGDVAGSGAASAAGAGAVRGAAAQVGAIYRALLSPQVAAAEAGRDPGAVSYTGDKDPRLIEFLPLIRELFPESHVIQIVRDPRDVLLSKSKAAWSRDRSWRANLAAGRFQLDLGDRFGRELWGWRYHVVRYEDLLEAPERTLRRLTAELDLDFDSQMLEFGTAAEQLGRGNTEEWKKETLGPLLTNNAGKWREGLPPKQVRLMELVYRRWMDRYGYRSSQDGDRGGRVAPLVRFAARLLATVFYGGASALYGWYRRIKVEGVRRRLRG